MILERSGLREDTGQVRGGGEGPFPISGTLCAKRGLVRISRKDNKSIIIYLEGRAKRASHPNEARLPCPGSQKLSLALLLFGDEPKLLQCAQVIVSFPLLDYLAVLEAVESYAFDFDLSASGGAKLLRLSLVGTTYGIAAYRLSPRNAAPVFGDTAGGKPFRDLYSISGA